MRSYYQVEVLESDGREASDELAIEALNALHWVTYEKADFGWLVQLPRGVARRLEADRYIDYQVVLQATTVKVVAEMPS